MIRLPQSPLCLALWLVACGGSQPPPGERAGSEAATPAADVADEPSFASQAQAGQALYGQHCAGCHGDSGQGGEAPAVVGLSSGALPLDPPQGARARTGQFRTVADIAAFVVANMPPGKAGSLSEAEYWSILAFDLKANGIQLDELLTPELAATLEVPR
jgi:cytochrome c